MARRGLFDALQMADTVKRYCRFVNELAYFPERPLKEAEPGRTLTGKDYRDSLDFIELRRRSAARLPSN